MCLKTYPCKAGVDDDVGLGRLRRPRPSLSDTFRIGPKRLMPTRDINRRTSPPTSVGARAVGSGGRAFMVARVPVHLTSILREHDPTPPRGRP